MARHSSLVLRGGYGGLGGVRREGEVDGERAGPKRWLWHLSRKILSSDNERYLEGASYFLDFFKIYLMIARLVKNSFLA